MKLKLNTLTNAHVIGQLYINNQPTNEIMVIQHGKALSLNTNRFWDNVYCANNIYEIRPVAIQALEVDPVQVMDRFTLTIITNSNI